MLGCPVTGDLCFKCGGVHQGEECYIDCEDFHRAAAEFYRRELPGAGVLCVDGGT